jgi:PAS domain S-box-containing protein
LDHYQRLAEGAMGYALFLLDPGGRVVSWTVGARRLAGYREDDILGEPYSRLFFRSEEVERGEAEQDLERARKEGVAVVARWYARQDASVFWGAGGLIPVRDAGGVVFGFANLIRDRTSQKMEGTAPEPATDATELVATVEQCRGHLLRLLRPPGGVP